MFVLFFFGFIVKKNGAHRYRAGRLFLRPRKKREKSFSKPLDKLFGRVYNMHNSFTKEAPLMTVNKFFYYFAQGCPSFVKSEI